MSQELRDAMHELAAKAGSHPEPDELAAYHDGELSPERERQIQDHLVACRECAGLLLDLDGLADADFGAGSGLAEKEAVWTGLREEMHREGATAPVVPIRRPVLSSPRRLQALAASLLVATIGLSLWVASLQGKIRELTATEANVPPINLYSGTARGEGSPTLSFKVSRKVRFQTFILTPHGPRRNKYRAVIERSHGEEIWSGWLEPNEVYSLSLGLSPQALGAGEYRIHLLGEDGKPIEDYVLHVTDP